VPLAAAGLLCIAREGMCMLDLFERMQGRCPDLLTPQEFEACVCTERLRARRIDAVFTVALFTPAGSGEPLAALSALASLAWAASRIARGSDGKGLVNWGGAPGLAVLLLDTPLDNAQRVCDAVEKAYLAPDEPQRDVPALRIERWTYPETPAAIEEAEQRGLQPGAQRRSPLRWSGLGTPLPSWKRAFDIVLSSVVLLVFLPLLALIAVYIWVVSPGPILFRQERVGYLGTLFTCLKFRTMVHNADTGRHRDHYRTLVQSGAQAGSDKSATAMVKLEDDPQIIPAGWILRSLGLDEPAPAHPV
jgi:hypothetical protein